MDVSYHMETAVDNTIFTRVESDFIRTLSPNALRSYAATRSFANGSGNVTRTPQERMAERAGIKKTRFIEGLKEAQQAGAVSWTQRPRSAATYRFTKVGTRFAAVPNCVLIAACQRLTAKDLQVLLAMYLHVRSDTGITWVSGPTLIEITGLQKSNLYRAQRNIRTSGLARRCEDDGCGTRDRHWHLITHKVCALSDLPKCHSQGTECDTPGCHQARTEDPETRGRRVSQGGDTMKTRYLNGKKTTNTRASRAQHEQPESEPPVLGEGIHRPTTPTSEDGPSPQYRLAERLREVVSWIKPGILWRTQDRMMAMKWFREHLDHGWTVETCHKVIDRFAEDPGTPLALSQKRPPVAFFAYARVREGQFTETATQQQKEITARAEESQRRIREMREEYLRSQRERKESR